MSAESARRRAERRKGMQPAAAEVDMKGAPGFAPIPGEEQAIVALVPGRHFAVVAFLSGKLHEADWLCAAFRDGPQGDWKIRYRFRYYHPESRHPFDDMDERSRTDIVAAAKLTEDEVVADVRQLAEGLRDHGFNDKLAFFEFRTSDLETVRRTMAAQPWCHHPSILS